MPEWERDDLSGLQQESSFTEFSFMARGGGGGHTTAAIETQRQAVFLVVRNIL